LIAFRKAHPVLHRATFFQGRAIHGEGVRDIEFYRPDGGQMEDGEWSDGLVRCIGMLLNGQLMNEVDAQGAPLRDDVLLLLFNASHEEITFRLPGAEDGPHWHPVLDTARAGGDPPAPISAGGQCQLQGRSLAVFSQDGEEWATHYDRYEPVASGIELAPVIGTLPAQEHTIIGTVVTLASFASPQLDNRRDILVYLPPGYDQGHDRYPVLYMQDGQNLFDVATSYGGVEWRVDEMMEELAGQGIQAIVVGIANMGDRRLDEYSPFVDGQHSGGQGDAYLDFVAQTLKPHIDRAFRTRPEPEHTTIAGSTLGGLISLYGLLSRTETFGNAAVFSPALWLADGAIFEWAEQLQAAAGRLYLDIGTAEGDETSASARRLVQLLAEKGMREGERLRYHEGPGAEHSDSAWAERFLDAVRWLVGEATDSNQRND
jgi:glycogen operon protein